MTSGVIAVSDHSVRFGKFVVSNRIGVGGMGEVFRATVDRGSREVALKLIRPEHATDPKFRRMFVHEARIGALISHSNIVRIYEQGEIDGVLYLTMEHVDGVSLDRVLAGGPLPVSLAAYVAIELLEGLRYAHNLCDEAGTPLHLVHRDVSSSNVLVSRTGHIKLTDFGVAKAVGLSMTMTSEVKGKRAYMAPEQLVASSTGANVDARTDVFAVGGLLHRMVVGEPPFHDVADWLQHGARVGADGPLGPVIARALAAQAIDRYASAADFALAIRDRVGAVTCGASELANRVAAATPVDKGLAIFDKMILADFTASASTGAHRPSHVDSLRDEAPATTRSRRRRFGVLIVSCALATGAAILVAALYSSNKSSEAVAAREPGTPVVMLPATTPPIAAEPPPSPARPERPRVKPGSVAKVERKAAPPAREAPGFLTLRTEPWATVYLGSEKLGTTPFFHVKVPAGRLKLMVDVQNSGRRLPLEVTIAADQEQRLTRRL